MDVVYGSFLFMPTTRPWLILAMTRVISVPGNPFSSDLSEGDNLNYSTNLQGPLKQIVSFSGSNPSFLGNWLDGFGRVRIRCCK